MKQYLSVLIFCILFLTISIPPAGGVNAQVVISEIAWMGTSASANDEWIELFNTSEETIVLDGWTLFAADETPTIPLSGSVIGGGYFLLERTNDETIPNISADVIYVGALGNAGEDLVLRTESGTEVTHVPASDSWPAGDNTTKQTMQWINGNWVTGDATPKAGYIQPVVIEEELKPVPEPAPEQVQVPEPKPEVVITPTVQQPIEEKPVIEIPKQIPQSISSEPTPITPLASSAATSTPVITSIIQEVKPKEISPKKVASSTSKQKKEPVALSAILNQKALAGGIYEVETPRSFWQNILSLPYAIITFIKSFFT